MRDLQLTTTNDIDIICNRLEVRHWFRILDISVTAQNQSQLGDHPASLWESFLMLTWHGNLCSYIKDVLQTLCYLAFLICKKKWNLVIEEVQRHLWVWYKSPSAEICFVCRLCKNYVCLFFESLQKLIRAMLMFILVCVIPCWVAERKKGWVKCIQTNA